MEIVSIMTATIRTPPRRPGIKAPVAPKRAPAHPPMPMPLPITEPDIWPDEICPSQRRETISPDVSP